MDIDESIGLSSGIAHTDKNMSQKFWLKTLEKSNAGNCHSPRKFQIHSSDKLTLSLFMQNNGYPVLVDNSKGFFS